MLRSPMLAPVICLSLSACTPEAEDSGTGTLEPADSAVFPHDNAPVIVSFTGAPGEPIETEDGDLQATILLLVEFIDDDGDCNVIDLSVWADAVIDGAVDTAGTAMILIQDQALEDSQGNIVDEGEGFGGTLGLSQGVTGGDLEFETEYEFAAIVYDNAGTPSAAAIAVGMTPAELVE